MEVGAGCQRASHGLRDFSFSGGVPILGLQYQAKGVPTLPETNIAPKKDGWNTTFLLGFRPMFRGKIAVSFGRVDFYTATQQMSRRVAKDQYSRGQLSKQCHNVIPQMWVHCCWCKKEPLFRKDETLLNPLKNRVCQLI